MKLSTLYAPPLVNPINGKARSVPVFNLVNVYGRVFFFSWFGFMMAFCAWYAYPPLLTHTIKADLHLSPAQVANSNIVSLCATLAVRFISGPLCDNFGPRLVFGGLLLVGSIPLGLAPLVQNASGLYANRFFIGILGGSFVPCQVWTTAFFDKNVVGTANALAGGWGNAGGGVTYFIMPAVLNSLMARGYTSDKAWRISFVVPLVLVVTTAVALLLLCPDTPNGRWDDRAQVGSRVAGHIDGQDSSTRSVEDGIKDADSKPLQGQNDLFQNTAANSSEEKMDVAKDEIVVKPTFKEATAALLSPQTLFLVMSYFCSFGSELAINSILSSYYKKNFPSLGQTDASEWAAMFGFLNFVTRPLGGVIGDLLYRRGRSVWAKKFWITTCGTLTGVMLILIGQLDPHDQATMFVLIALLAIFCETGNGANFALVPHVHPHANGIISGVTGAGGNLGGVVFAILFRFLGSGTDYAKSFWVIGVVHLAVNLGLAWIPPLPRGQIGGR